MTPLLIPNIHSQVALQAAALVLRVHLHTRQVLVARHIDGRVSLKEVCRPQVDLEDIDRHDGPILHTRVVREAKHAPHDDVLVLDVLLALDGIADAIHLLGALQREAAAGVQLVVLVLGHPHVVLRELSALALHTLRVGEQQLGGGRRELVADGLAADAVVAVGVDDLKHAVVLRRGVGERGRLDGRLADLVVVAARVGLGVHGHRVRLLLDDGVGMTIDGRVDARAEDVLVVLGERTRVDDVAVVALLAWVDVDDADDAGGARLDDDAAGLVELVGEDVLVVGQGNDELHDQLAVAGHNGAARSPVGVLPADAVVLLVQTDDVGMRRGFAVTADDDGIEILDHAQAVAAEGKIVGAVTGTTVSEIEGLLSLERRALF